MFKKLFTKKEDKTVKNIGDDYTENFMRNYEELRKEIVERQED